LIFIIKFMWFNLITFKASSKVFKHEQNWFTDPEPHGCMSLGF
jgi:hypothetical protein